MRDEDVDRLRFAARDTLGDRLELVREAGAGGMGTVYEAVDRNTGQKLAVKVLSWEGKRSLDRFDREAEVLESLSHPAIVAYVAHGTTRQGKPYLAMEWLDGLPLSRRLAEGVISLDDVVKIGARVASALVASHSIGVLHRDVKPSNIMLRGGYAGEAVLLDFGVAFLINSETLTSTGQLVGTFGYMAPEQARGQELDGRADLFALGCVLYEVIAGEPAFVSSDPVSLLADLLVKEPPLIATRRSGVPPRLAALVDALLVKDRTLRPGTAVEIETELLAIARALTLQDAEALCDQPERWSRRIVEPTLRETGPTRRRTRSRTVGSRRWIAIAAVAIVVAAGVGVLLHRADDVSRPYGAVAVLSVRDERGNAAMSSTALADTLRRELEAAGELAVVSGETSRRVEAELGLSPVERLAPTMLARVCRTLGADVIVLGSYAATGGDVTDEIRLVVRVQDCATRKVRVVARARDAIGRLDDVVAIAGEHLREALGARPLAPTQVAQLRAAQPPTPAVARIFATAREHARRKEYGPAIARLDELLDAAPTYAPARRVLAEVLYFAGFEQRSTLEAERAALDSRGLPEEERIEIEAYYELSKGNDEAAATLYRRLAARKRDVDLELRLALVLAYTNDYESAYRVLESARLYWPNDPRIELREAVLARRHNDAPRMQAATERAASKASTSSSLLAEARLRLAELAMNRGDHARAIDLTRQASKAFQTTGDRAGEAEATEILATIMSRAGKVSEARRLYDQNIEVYRLTGSLRGEADALNSAGWMALELGDLAAALTTFRDEQRLFEEAHNDNGVALAQGQLARVAFEQDRLDEARELWAVSAKTFERMKRRKDLARRKAALAEVAIDRGDLGLARGLLREAGELRKAIADPIELASARIDDAALLLAEAKPADAKVAALDAIARCANMRSDEVESRAQLILVEVLLANGEPDAALRELAVHTAGSERARVRLGRVELAARIELARGRRQQALLSLETTIAEYEALGMSRRARLARRYVK